MAFCVTGPSPLISQNIGYLKTMAEKNNAIQRIPDGKIMDYIDNKLRNDTPEEYVRQNIEKRLILEHKHDRDQVKVEFPIKTGSTKKRVDLASFPKGKNHDSEKYLRKSKIVIQRFLI